MQVTVHEIIEQELELVHHLSHKIWPECYRSIISEAQITYMLDTMYSLPALRDAMAQGQRFLVAYRQNQAVGYAGFEPNIASKPKCKLNKLYVLPHLHGVGIGKVLIEAVIVHAKNQRCTSLFLQVNKQNPAVAFYEKMGMYVREEAVFDIGNGFVMDDYIMQMDW